MNEDLICPGVLWSVPVTFGNVEKEMLECAFH